MEKIVSIGVQYFCGLFIVLGIIFLTDANYPLLNVVVATFFIGSALGAANGTYIKKP